MSPLRLKPRILANPINWSYWLLVIVLLFLPSARCLAQHLWWDKGEQKDSATCLYGEITVLATNPGIYYCGANWWPGEAAGGYCGIQHNGPKERRTIFSIWDTSPKLCPVISEADRRTFFGRFGGEGEGGHTHMLWDWREREAFRYFVHKVAGEKSDTTDARYYIYDIRRKAWLHSATITSPNGKYPSVSTLGGGINSFLENYSGGDKSIPKIALYSLWLGSQPDKMECLTKAGGDGIWGQLDGRYFLAEGDSVKLKTVFTKLEKQYGQPNYAIKDKELPKVPDRPLSSTIIKELKSLPQAESIDNTFYTPEDGKKYTIRSAKSGKRLATKNGLKRTGVDLVQDNSPETPTVWRLEKVGDAFQMISPNNLVVEATGTAAGGAVQMQQRRKGEAKHQLWEFVKVEDAYHIVSKRDGLVLDLESGSELDGARIILYGRKKDTPAANQLWILSEVKK